MTITAYLDKLRKAGAAATDPEGKPFAEAMADNAEIWSNGACAGYAAAAAIDAGFTPAEVEAILSKMAAAFDRMTVDQAEAYHSSEKWRQL